MLVLSRKEGQSVELPSLGVRVHIVKTASGQVRLGFDAPPEVDIRRGELVGDSMTPNASRPTVVPGRVSEPRLAYVVG